MGRREIELWKSHNIMPNRPAMSDVVHFTKRIVQNMDFLSIKPYAKFVEGDEEFNWTWGDLRLHCNWVIEKLESVEQGVALIFLRGMREMHCAFFGCMLSGMVPSFMPCTSKKQDPGLYWKSHSSLLDHISPVVIITTSDVHGEMLAAGLDLRNTNVIELDDLEPKRSAVEFRILDEGDTALLQHSSGTTGLKKGVALSNRSVALHAESYSAMIGCNDSDIVASWLPLYHDMGLMACLLMPAYIGIPIIQMDPFEWVSEPSKFLKMIERGGATITWMPNFSFHLYGNISGVIEDEIDLSNVRAWINCSEVCKPVSIDLFAENMSKFSVDESSIHCCYAMAETVFAAAQTDVEGTDLRVISPPENLERGKRIIPSEKGVTLASSGKPVHGLEIKIYNENHTEVEDGIVGEIGISGDYLFQGYFGLEDLSRKALQGGVYFTNDLGFIYSDEIFVLGRVDDVIIVQGRNLYAHQIEAILSSINGLKPGRNVAFGVSDENLGSDSLVVICEKSHDSKQDERIIKREIRTRLESEIGVIPRKIRIEKSGWLMKTSSGKISRKENKRKYLNEIRL